MGRHSNTNTLLTGRYSQPPGLHEYGIGLIPCGDRDRGDPKKYEVEERSDNNDPNIDRFFR